jgi:glucose-1-phosphate cytidylyltransferase
MKKYSLNGFKKLVVCAGFKLEVIKSYFPNYDSMNNDFTVRLSNFKLAHLTMRKIGKCSRRHRSQQDDRSENRNGRESLPASHFAVTYGDAVRDADLEQEFELHKKHEKIGTVIGLAPPSRLGEFKLHGDLVTEFSQKPTNSCTWINGGFFFCSDFFNYFDEDLRACLSAVWPPIANLRFCPLRILVRA